MPEMLPLKTAVLLSGNGTTLQNLIDRRAELPIDIKLVVASRTDAYGLTRAQNAGIETATVASKNFRRSGGKTDWDAMGDALNSILLPRNFDLVLFAGFMCFYPLPKKLVGKTLNIHPSLLPAFGGRGMFGRRVHEAVKAAGVKITGCTVHQVSDIYDGGKILAQSTCEIDDADDVAEIAKKVFALECDTYPRAIRLFADENVKR